MVEHTPISLLEDNLPMYTARSFVRMTRDYMRMNARVRSQNPGRKKNKEAKEKWLAEKIAACEAGKQRLENWVIREEEANKRKRRLFFVGPRYR